MFGIFLIMIMGFIASLPIHNHKYIHEITKESYVGFMNGNGRLLKKIHYSRRESHSKSRRLQIIDEQREMAYLKANENKLWSRYVRAKAKYEKHKKLSLIYVMMHMPVAPWTRTGDIYALVVAPHFRPQYTRMIRNRVKSKWSHYSSYKTWIWAFHEYVRPNLFPTAGEAINPFRRSTYHVRNIAGVVLPFALISIGFPVMFGAEYYVDYDSGNDTTGDGSINTPWKTCYQVFRVESFNAGDIIYFRKGVTWEEERGGSDCFAPASGFGPGTSGNEIVIDGGTWGTGANAIYDGGTGGEVNQPGNLETSGCDYTYWMNLTIIDSNSSSWTFHGGGSHLVGITMDTIYVYRTGLNAMIGSDYDDILITDCKALEHGAGFDGVGISMGGRNTGSSLRFTVRNCEAYNETILGNDGIQCHEESQQIDGPGLYLNNTASGWEEQGFDFTTGGYSDPDYHIIILGNLSYNNYGSYIFGHEHAEGSLTRFGYNRAYDCDQGGTYFSGAFYNTGNNRTYQCLFEVPDGARYCFQLDRQQTDNIGPQNVKIECCTIICEGSLVSVFWYGDRDQYGGINDFESRDNIIICLGTGNKRIHYISSALTTFGTLGTLEYNHHYIENGNWYVEDDEEYDWTDWTTTLGNGTGSTQNVNPNLVDVTGSTSGFPDDAKLQSNSPCIGQGVAITTGEYFRMPSGDIKVDDHNSYAMTGIQYDAEDKLKDAENPDIGMYEYEAGEGVTPTVTNLNLTNITFIIS